MAITRNPFAPVYSAFDQAFLFSDEGTLGSTGHVSTAGTCDHENKTLVYSTPTHNSYKCDDCGMLVMEARGNENIFFANGVNPIEYFATLEEMSLGKEEDYRFL